MRSTVASICGSVPQPNTGRPERVAGVSAHRASLTPSLLALGAIGLWSSLATLGVALGHVPPFLLTGLSLLIGSLPEHFDGAGHAIVFPTVPTTQLVYAHPVSGRLSTTGGAPAANAHADEASWLAVLTFLAQAVQARRHTTN